MGEKRAVVQILGAGFCWGIIGVFSKPMAKFGFTSFQITAVRCFITLLGLCIALFIVDKRLFCIHIKDSWMFLGTGILSIVLFNVCYFQTISSSTLGFAAILLYTAPFFVIILSAIFYRERITKKKIVALLLAFAGCLLVTGVSSDKIPFIAILTGLGSGIGYALYTIFGNVALKKYEPLTVTFYTFLFASIGILPFGKMGEMSSLLVDKPLCIGIGVLLGIVSTLIPFILYTKGLKSVEPGKASILAFAEPFVATIAGIMMFHETTTLAGLIGLVSIFTAICILNK